MPSPKSGKAGRAVAPAAPTKPAEADVADPGEMAKLKSQQHAAGTGKYGGMQAVPFKAPTNQDTDEAVAGGAPTQEKTWIEIELVDENDEPVPGEKYRVTLPDGRVTSGTLNDKGFVHIGSIPPGTCQIAFPNLDRDAWERA